MTDLSIIIVNWNSATYLDTCIRTLCENTEGLNYEIIVVDNASYDGSAGVARRHGNSVRFVQSNENLGFARANNLGYVHSSGKTLLFLNPGDQGRCFGPNARIFIRPSGGRMPWMPYPEFRRDSADQLHPGIPDDHESVTGCRVAQEVYEEIEALGDGSVVRSFTEAR